MHAAGRHADPAAAFGSLRKCGSCFRTAAVVPKVCNPRNLCPTKAGSRYRDSVQGPRPSFTKLDVRPCVLKTRHYFPVVDAEEMPLVLHLCRETLFTFTFTRRYQPLHLSMTPSFTAQKNDIKSYHLVHFNKHHPGWDGATGCRSADSASRILVAMDKELAPL